MAWIRAKDKAPYAVLIRAGLQIACEFSNDMGYFPVTAHPMEPK
ncbi:hypothetical protein [Ruegeria lacuscaerulensis]|nr:hypothetical protein [Ruegeria lacuscaerulensis]